MLNRVVLITRESEIWDYILEHGIATEETLQVVTNINGYSEESLSDLLYAVTVYYNIEQYKEE